MSNNLNSAEHVRYIEHQKRKTADPQRQQKWRTDEWETKLVGFIEIFKQYSNLFSRDGSCVCLGARTGQEVAALRLLGYKSAVGIDLIAFPPYTIEGDFHSLPFPDQSVSLIYSNAVDHVRDLGLWSRELLRVLKDGGYILLNLQVGVAQDEYSVQEIKRPLQDLVRPYFPALSCVRNAAIPVNIHAMNWELLLQK